MNIERELRRHIPVRYHDELRRWAEDGTKPDSPFLHACTLGQLFTAVDHADHDDMHSLLAIGEFCLRVISTGHNAQ